LARGRGAGGVETEFGQQIAAFGVFDEMIGDAGRRMPDVEPASSPLRARPAEAYEPASSAVTTNRTRERRANFTSSGYRLPLMTPTAVIRRVDGRPMQASTARAR
jgi:hypothetical protein